jgi:PBP1b-binding outer membrane lipoprotein LpoB
MKKTLLLALFIAIFLVSCKKSSQVAPANTLSATFDGTNESLIHIYLGKMAPELR